MDKRRVTRIPSIFDSDDDEEEVSRSEKLNKEEGEEEEDSHQISKSIAGELQGEKVPPTEATDGDGPVAESDEEEMHNSNGGNGDICGSSDDEREHDDQVDGGSDKGSNLSEMSVEKGKMSMEKSSELSIASSDKGSDDGRSSDKGNGNAVVREAGDAIDMDELQSKRDNRMSDLSEVEECLNDNKDDEILVEGANDGNDSPLGIQQSEDEVVDGGNDSPLGVQQSEEEVVDGGNDSPLGVQQSEEEVVDGGNDSPLGVQQSEEEVVDGGNDSPLGVQQSEDEVVDGGNDSHRDMQHPEDEVVDDGDDSHLGVKHHEVDDDDDASYEGMPHPEEEAADDSDGSYQGMPHHDAEAEDDGNDSYQGMPHPEDEAADDGDDSYQGMPHPEDEIVDDDGDDSYQGMPHPENVVADDGDDSYQGMPHSENVVADDGDDSYQGMPHSENDVADDGDDSYQGMPHPEDEAAADDDSYQGMPNPEDEAADDDDSYQGMPHSEDDDGDDSYQGMPHPVDEAEDDGDIPKDDFDDSTDGREVYSVMNEDNTEENVGKDNSENEEADEAELDDVGIADETRDVDDKGEVVEEEESGDSDDKEEEDIGNEEIDNVDKETKGKENEEINRDVLDVDDDDDEEMNNDDDEEMNNDDDEMNNDDDEEMNNDEEDDDDDDVISLNDSLTDDEGGDGTKESLDVTHSEPDICEIQEMEAKAVNDKPSKRVRSRSEDSVGGEDDEGSDAYIIDYNSSEGERDDKAASNSNSSSSTTDEKQSLPSPAATEKLKIILPKFGSKKPQMVIPVLPKKKKRKLHSASEDKILSSSPSVTEVQSKPGSLSLIIKTKPSSQSDTESGFKASSPASPEEKDQFGSSSSVESDSEVTPSISTDDRAKLTIEYDKSQSESHLDKVGEIIGKETPEKSGSEMGNDDLNTTEKENDQEMLKAPEKNPVVPHIPEMPKRKIPLVQVHVPLGDLQAYCKSSSNKRAKEVEEMAVDDSEATESVDGEEQKLSISPETTESVDVEEQKPSGSQSPRPENSSKPRIWISKSIFAKTATPTRPSKPTEILTETLAETLIEMPAVKPTVKPTRRGKSSGVSFDQKKCLLTLEKGWRREMVYRATSDANITGKVRADIYYYTPEGKKLRSRVEIEDYLLRKKVSELNIDHFTFAKTPIGGSEEQEIIRHATKTPTNFIPKKKVGTGTPSQSSSPLADTNIDTNITPKTSQLKRGRPRKVLTGSPAKRFKTSDILSTPVSNSDSTKSTTFRLIKPKEQIKLQQNVNAGKQIKLQQNVNAGKGKVQVATSAVRPVSSLASRPPNSAGLQDRPSVAASEKPIALVMSKKNTDAVKRKYEDKNHVVFTTKICDSGKAVSRILTPMLSESKWQQTFHCTGTCQLGKGTVPNLQCIKCLCLFHGRCTQMPDRTVELIQSGGARFICPNCYKEKKDMNEQHFNPATPHEPFAHDPTSSSESDDDDDKDLENKNEDTPKGVDKDCYPLDFLRVNFNKRVNLPTPPSSPPPYQPEIIDVEDEAVRGVTQVNDSDSYPGFPVPNTPIPPGAQPSLGTTLQSMASAQQIFKIQTPGGRGTQYIFVRPQQSGINLQAPGMNLQPTGMNLQPTGMNLQPTNPGQVRPVRAVYLPTAAGQMPLVMSSPGGPTYIASGPQYVSGGNTSSMPAYVSLGMKPIPSVIEKEKTPPIEQAKIPVVQRKVLPKNFFQEISLSYRLLLRVFKYLTAKDLLVTSQVCLMWRDLSYSSTLWSNLRLRNICVKDWDLLAMFLERRNTQHIDLRKMVFRVISSTPELENCKDTEFSESSSPRSSQCNERSQPLQRRDSSQKSDREFEKTKEFPSVADGNEDHETKVDNASKPTPRELSSSPERKRSRSPGGSEDVTSEKGKSDSKITSPLKDSERNTSPSQVKEDCDDSSNKPSRGTKETSLECDNIPSVGEASVSPTRGPRDDNKPSTSPVSKKEHDRVSVPSDAAEKSSSQPEEQPPGEDEKSSGPSAKSSDPSAKLSDSPDSEDKPMEIDEGDNDSRGINDVTVEADRNTISKPKELDEKDHMHTISREQSSSRAKGSTAETKKCKTPKDKVVETWQQILEALGTVRCLKSIVLPPCTPQIVHLVLTNCRSITSLSVTNVMPSDIQFDPSYLMEASKLKELRLRSTQGITFSTNFNFIKLQELKVLVIKGFAGSSWPYLGTGLKSLHLGPCHNFDRHTWNNIGCMTDLRAMWLEDGGSTANDPHMVEALGRLTQLQRLCLFNFTVNVKLGLALKRLTKLERLFVLQSSSSEASMGLKNHNMLAVTEHLKYVDEVVWAVSSQDVKVIHGVDHMHIISPKVKSYPSLLTSENSSDHWPLRLLETVIKRHLPMTKVRIMKLDPAAAARMAISTL